VNEHAENMGDLIYQQKLCLLDGNE